MEVLSSQSYSKNLGLYGERVGALNYVSGSKEVASKVLSQLKRIARAMYSNPPVHGARIVANVIGDESLFEEWKEEMMVIIIYTYISFSFLISFPLPPGNKSCGHQKQEYAS